MNFIGAGREGNDFTPITPYEELSDRRKFPDLGESLLRPRQTRLSQ